MNAAAIALLALLAQAPPSAPRLDAQAKVRAQALLREGTTLFDGGDPAGALTKFEAAYRVYPSPKIWFNVGQAKRDLGRRSEALEAFEWFLDGAKDAPPETIAEARRSVAELRGTDRAPPSASLPAALPPRSDLYEAPTGVAAAPESSSAREPLHKRRWFWPAVGAVVLVGVIVAVSASSGGTDVPGTTLGAQRAFR